MRSLLSGIEKADMVFQWGINYACGGGYCLTKEVNIDQKERKELNWAQRDMERRKKKD